MKQHLRLFIASLLVLLVFGEPVSAQTFYHPGGSSGLTLGAGYGHLTGENVNTFSVEAIGTVMQRLDVSASSTWIRPSFGRRDGWSGTLIGTGYVFAAPEGFVGLSLGLAYTSVGSVDDVGVVYGSSLAGRIESAVVTLIPQLTIAGVTSFGDGDDTSGAVGVALGIGAVEGNPSLVLEPFASYGIDSGVVSVGGTLRVAVGT